MHRDDVPRLVLLHKAAFAGSLGVSLGDGYLNAFLQWFIECPGAISLVCQRDQQMVGYVFGAPEGYGPRLNRDLFSVIVRAVLTHPGLLVRSSFWRQIPVRLRTLLTRRSPDAAPTKQRGGRYRLVGIGVHPDHRRSGLGERLMHAFEERAWALGYTEIQLSVYADNLAAQKLYRSCGWEQTTFGREVVHYSVRRTPEREGA